MLGKYFRNLMCLVFVLLLLPIQSIVAQHNTDFTHTVPSQVLRAMEMQEPALRAYQILWNSFEKDELGNPIYPDEYAGEYISENKLVIMLVNPTKELIEEYTRRTHNSDYVVIEKASYSLNHLNSFNDIAYQLIKKGYDISSYGVDRKANTFFIAVTPEDLDKLMIEISPLMLNKDESSPIRIELGTLNTSTLQIWGGDGIKNEDTGSRFSVGIGGSYNGNDAILTAGHGNEKVGIIFTRYPYIEFAGRRTGQVVYQRANLSPFENGVDSLGDFAIVELDGTDTPTNRVYGGVSITGTYSSVPVGTTIYKYGATTGYSWGTVTQISLTVTYTNGFNNIYIVSGLTQSVLQNSSNTDAIAPGDSGGPVYMKDGNAYKLHGIVTARVEPENGPATIMYSTPIYYAEHEGFIVKTSN